MTDKRLVFTTCSSADEARQIAQELVQRRLAACVNIVPQIESVYRWQGEIESSSEWLLIVKTTAAAFAQRRDALSELHSYEVPECIAIAIEDGSEVYLKWMPNAVGETMPE